METIALLDVNKGGVNCSAKRRRGKIEVLAWRWNRPNAYKRGNKRSRDEKNVSGVLICSFISGKRGILIIQSRRWQTWQHYFCLGLVELFSCLIHLLDDLTSFAQLDCCICGQPGLCAVGPLLSQMAVATKLSLSFASITMVLLTRDDPLVPVK